MDVFFLYLHFIAFPSHFFFVLKKLEADLSEFLFLCLFFFTHLSYSSSAKLFSQKVDPHEGIASRGTAACMPTTVLSLSPSQPTQKSPQGNSPTRKTKRRNFLLSWSLTLLQSNYIRKHYPSLSLAATAEQTLTGDSHRTPPSPHTQAQGAKRHKAQRQKERTSPRRERTRQLQRNVSWRFSPSSPLLYLRCRRSPFPGFSFFLLFTSAFTIPVKLFLKIESSNFTSRNPLNRLSKKKFEERDRRETEERPQRIGC